MISFTELLLRIMLHISSITKPIKIIHNKVVTI